MSQRTVACRPRFANLIHGQLPVYEIRAVRSAPFHAQVMRPTAGCDAVSSSVRWWIVGIISFSPNLCLYRTRTDPLVLPPNWARDLFLAGLHLIQVNFLGGLACSKGTKRPIKTGQAYSKMHTRVQQEYIFPRPPQIHSWSMFKFQKLQSVTVPSLISSGSVNRSIKAATAAIQKKKKKKESRTRNCEFKCPKKGWIFVSVSNSKVSSPNRIPSGARSKLFSKLLPNNQYPGSIPYLNPASFFPEFHYSIPSVSVCSPGCMRAASTWRPWVSGLVGHFVQTWPDSELLSRSAVLRL